MHSGTCSARSNLWQPRLLILKGTALLRYSCCISQNAFDRISAQMPVTGFLPRKRQPSFTIVPMTAAPHLVVSCLGPVGDQRRRARDAHEVGAERGELRRRPVRFLRHGSGGFGAGKGVGLRGRSSAPVSAAVEYGTLASSTVREAPGTVSSHARACGKGCKLTSQEPRCRMLDPKLCATSSQIGLQIMLHACRFASLQP